MTSKRCVVAVLCAVLFAASAAGQCISTLVAVSQPVVFPNHEAGPIAWSGSRLGVAKLDAEQPFKNTIWFGVYDANLNQIGSDVDVADVSLSGARLLLWNGSEFVLFYQTSDFQISFQRIDTNGNPIGGPIAVAPTHPKFAGQEYDVAWDASRNAYLVLRTSPTGFERGLWLSIVGTDGSVKSDELITSFTTTPAYPRVAVTASGVIGLIWSHTVNNGTTEVQELTFSVVVPGKAPIGIVSAGRNGANPVLATAGSVFFEVYNAPATPGTTALRSIKFDTSARVVTADAPLLSGGVDVVPVSLIANSARSEWAALYINYFAGIGSQAGGEARLLRIPFSGGVLTDGPLSQDPTKTTLLPQSGVVWNGSAYLATIGRLISRGDGTDSYIVRQCPLTVTVTATPNPNNLFAPVTFTAQATGGLAPYLYAWTFGDLSSGSGQTITHGYTQLGTYTVTVTATDINRATIATSVTVTIANLRHRSAKHN